jgi:anti-sigma B factor antagonist
MKMTFDERGAVGVLRVDEARIDASVAIQFKDRFRDLTEQGEGVVVLDLRSVEFLDSSGLGAVVAARKLLGPDRVLALAGLTPPVERVMTLTRMSSVFPIHRDVATALAAHGSQGVMP